MGNPSKNTSMATIRKNELRDALEHALKGESVPFTPEQLERMVEAYFPPTVSEKSFLVCFVHQKSTTEIGFAQTDYTTSKYDGMTERFLEDLMAFLESMPEFKGSTIALTNIIPIVGPLAGN